VHAAGVEAAGAGHEVALEEAAEADREEEAEAGLEAAAEEVVVEAQTGAEMRGVGSGQEVDSIANSTASE
jgi:hypothetical protein